VKLPETSSRNQWCQFFNFLCRISWISRYSNIFNDPLTTNLDTHIKIIVLNNQPNDDTYTHTHLGIL
jgi:hypothetical protein